MEKWLKIAGNLLLVIFGLLYVGAKIHFFTRYWVLGPSKYVEEHWPFWACSAIIGGIGACVGWMRERLGRAKTN